MNTSAAARSADNDCGDNRIEPDGGDSGWQARLELHYTLRKGRSVAQDRHVGPLRVLKPLHPEGPAICHHVLVHPPGGLVGGDRLHLQVQVDEGAHALLTTPGATRYYRSKGVLASQQVDLRLAAGARLEWLPLETIAHPGCLGLNRVRATLAAGAEMIGWDLLALGLPASAQPFVDRGDADADGDGGSNGGSDGDGAVAAAVAASVAAAAAAGTDPTDSTPCSAITQHLQLDGVWGPTPGASRWLDRARVAANDRLLLQSPAGWAGQSVLGTLWFGAGSALAARRRDALLDVARSLAQAHPLARLAGGTAVQPGVVVLRVLAPQVEPALNLMRQVRAAWRGCAWSLAAESPRIWST